MGFEPLETDEPLPQGVAREKDVDMQLLGGCTSFGIVALVVYGLYVLPFFLVTNAYQLSGLISAILFGLVPATVAGAAASKFLRLGGACGFLGGALAAGIFLLMRIQQIGMAGQADDALATDYPDVLRFVIPAAIAIWSAIVALIFLPKSEL